LRDELEALDEKMKDKILAADKDHQRVLAVRTQSTNA
jgi:hypothetical protein